MGNSFLKRDPVKHWTDDPRSQCRKLRSAQALAMALSLVASLVVPLHARAASPALDEQIVADAYVYLIGIAATTLVLGITYWLLRQGSRSSSWAD